MGMLTLCGGAELFVAWGGGEAGCRGEAGTSLEPPLLCRRNHPPDFVAAVRFDVSAVVVVLVVVVAAEDGGGGDNVPAAPPTSLLVLLFLCLCNKEVRPHFLEDSAVVVPPLSER